MPPVKMIKAENRPMETKTRVTYRDLPKQVAILCANESQETTENEPAVDIRKGECVLGVVFADCFFLYLFADTKEDQSWSDVSAKPQSMLVLIWVEILGVDI